MSTTSIKTWVVQWYFSKYCDTAGRQIVPLRLEEFQRWMQVARPTESGIIKNICDELDVTISKLICSHSSAVKNDRFEDPASVIAALHRFRPDLAERMQIAQVINRIEQLERGSTKELSLRFQGTIQQLLVAVLDDMTTPQSPQPPPSSRTRSKTKSITSAQDLVVLQPMAKSPNSNHAAADVSSFAKIYNATTNHSPASFPVPSAMLLQRSDINRSTNKNVNIKAETTTQTQATTRSTIPVLRMIDTGAPKPPKQPVKSSQKNQLLKDGFNLATPQGLEAWVFYQYAHFGFDSRTGFKGYTHLKTHLRNLTRAQPSLEKRTVATMEILRSSKKHPFYFSLEEHYGIIRNQGMTFFLQMALSATRFSKPMTGQHILDDGASRSATILRARPLEYCSLSNTQIIGSISSGQPVTIPDISTWTALPKNDLLARKLSQMQDGTNSLDESATPGTDGSMLNGTNGLKRASTLIESRNVNLLSSDDSDDMDLSPDSCSGRAKTAHIEIQQAPVIAENILSDESEDILPQYGLLGSYQKTKEKIFLNTNVPFSTFVCGVQGSGKSHTVSCILENAVISSPHLGRLKTPLSALVLSYSHFGGDGSGFCVSEAAFLAAPNPQFPGATHAERVHVLVSPSNYHRMSRMYLQIPNVTVSQFKLKPQNLDIDIMLSLMSVKEADEAPLYMATVRQLLRDMASEAWGFNYSTFKARLRGCRFNPGQRNMLQMRLDVLESFLDMNNVCPEPQFGAGEVTIIDLSCPFVDANTACILFRIGLHQYLRSQAKGKMVVLDEAHKYMLSTPGAKALNEALLTTIRLQRHYGVRVVISTQEPTLLADLIALCSVTILHRFSSPEWFAAIKRHISVRQEDHHTVLEAIEDLRTGSSLVYVPGAVVGKDETGALVKGTGQLLKIRMRKRLTCDGGQSVLAI